MANYGSEQLDYLEMVVRELKSFKKYEVNIVVHSNIPLDHITGIDKVTLFEKTTGIRTFNDFLVRKKWGKKWSGMLFNWQMLPMTCRRVIDAEADKYDVFLFNENDHLFIRVIYSGRNTGSQCNRPSMQTMNSVGVESLVDNAQAAYIRYKDHIQQALAKLL